MKPLLRVALTVATFGVAFPALAAVELQDGGQLTQALRKSPPCCIIDARSEASRERRPVADALPYRPGMKITPTAAAVVLADTDGEALAASRALAKDYPGKRIIAVKGGVVTWEATTAELAQAAPKGKPFQFVIPRNTCESGTPLQKLLSKPQ
ncbi:MAG: hypothetical protein HY778_08835 [Betaproteobacteria bacterium]|nr:hypothetical protein [Betaproteobacteria bacterium]